MEIGIVNEELKESIPHEEYLAPEEVVEIALLFFADFRQYYECESNWLDYFEMTDGSQVPSTPIQFMHADAQALEARVNARTRDRADAIEKNAEVEAEDKALKALQEMIKFERSFRDQLIDALSTDHLVTEVRSYYGKPEPYAARISLCRWVKKTFGPERGDHFSSLVDRDYEIATESHAGSRLPDEIVTVTASWLLDTYMYARENCWETIRAESRRVESGEVTFSNPSVKVPQLRKDMQTAVVSDGVELEEKTTKNHLKIFLNVIVKDWDAPRFSKQGLNYQYRTLFGIARALQRRFIKKRPNAPDPFKSPEDFAAYIYPKGHQPPPITEAELASCLAECLRRKNNPEGNWSSATAF